MSITSRNAPCPCGSGRKYKKCCFSPLTEPRLAADELIVPGTVRSFASRQEVGLGRSPSAHEWPVEGIYVPVPDIWRATGMGTAAIIRRRPDGRFDHAAFLLNLSEHGLTGALGKAAEASVPRDFLGDLRGLIPPMQQGSLADAAVFVYGAMALAEAQNAGVPPGEFALFLDLLPPPPGGAAQWLEALLGPGGPTPTGLMRIIGDLPAEADIADGKEIAVRTEMVFEVPQLEAMSTKPPAVFPRIPAAGDQLHFHYTPIPIWKRSKHGTAGKVQGEVQVHGDRVVATALTLSMAARLIGDLREWLGSRIRLQSVSWLNTFSRRRETWSASDPFFLAGPDKVDNSFPLLGE